MGGEDGAGAKPGKALGLLYWVLFWPVLVLVLAFGAGFMVDGAYVIGSLCWMAAFWLAAGSAWGRQRQKEALASPPEDRMPAFRKIRRVCRVLMLLNVMLIVLPLGMT